MARAPKNPNVERVAKFPFDKDAISPMPRIVPRPRARAASATGAPPGATETPAASGADLEPGRVHPFKRRAR